MWFLSVLTPAVNDLGGVQDNGMELVYKLYIEHWVYGLVPYRVDIASA